MSASRKREAVTALLVCLSLIALGVASAWLYNNARLLHRFSQGISAYIANYIGQFGLYLVACYLVLRLGSRSRPLLSVLTLVIVVSFGAYFRGRLVTQPPYLSSDVYRYIWDGRVQAAGINPYRYIPSAPEVAHLRDERIYPQINRRDYAQTIYPPFAQVVFLASYLTAKTSVSKFKSVMVGFDLVAALAIGLALVKLGQDPARLVVFAWHPLVIWEGAHSGHLESAVIACLALAVLAWLSNRPVLTGAALALAALLKYYPALLLPLLALPASATCAQGHQASRSRLRAVLAKLNYKTIGAFAATVLLAYVPYLGVGSNVLGYLPGYFKEEGFVDSGSRYFLLALTGLAGPTPTVVYSVVAVLALAGVIAWLLLREPGGPSEQLRGAVVLIGLFLALSTPRYSWYVAWIIPFLCFVPSIAWLYVTGASTLLYLLWLRVEEGANLPLWLGAALYVPTALLLYWERVKGARRSGSADPHILAGGTA